MANAIPVNTPSVDAGAAVETSSPPWHLIHFDVRCARCGHDLRGQVEPVCPACKLEFSWADAAPLEKLTCGKCNYHLYGLSDSRCPECGTNVDWNEALLRHHSSEKPLFEYRWRKFPLRSFVRTWFLALRPSRLWNQVTMHDPPRLKPLLLWMLIIITSTDILSLVATSLTGWIISWIETSQQWRPTLGAYWAEYLPFLLRRLTRRHWHLPFIFFGLWCVFTLCGLMLFRQSMRIYKVRTVHVVRVWAYSSVTFVPLVVLGAIALAVLAVAMGATGIWRPRWMRFWMYDSTTFFGVIATIHATWSIGQGYRKYLRMPHSFGIAIVSQVMGAMAALIVFLQMSLR